MAGKIQSPGAFLTLLLEKHNLNPFKLSKDIRLSQSAVRLIALGKTRVSVPVAMRLAKYFNTYPEYWLKMQMTWDIAEAAKDKELVKIVKGITKFEKDSTAKKPSAKKPAAKKPAAKKRAVKKPAAKAAAKKPAAKKPAAKKPAAKYGKKTGRTVKKSRY